MKKKEDKSDFLKYWILIEIESGIEKSSEVSGFFNGISLEKVFENIEVHDISVVDSEHTFFSQDSTEMLKIWNDNHYHPSLFRELEVPLDTITRIIEMLDKSK